MGRRESKYCEKCGCYIPEGETVCVSCGYDPTPKPARRPDPLADMYARDPWAIAQYHTPLPVDYAQLVNVAPKVRQRTLDEVLDKLEKESVYEQLAQAMNQTSCSTAQASEAFTQFARDHRDAQKQVMLHDILWAKGGKGNSSIITTPNCIKNNMDKNCLELCEYCYLENEDRDIYTNSILRTYKCKKNPHFSGRVEKQNGQ